LALRAAHHCTSSTKPPIGVERAWSATGASRETVCKNCLKGPFFAFAQVIAFERKELSCLTIVFDGAHSGSAFALSLS
jgi:hypothetical protein